MCADVECIVRIAPDSANDSDSGQNLRSMDDDESRISDSSEMARSDWTNGDRR